MQYLAKKLSFIDIWVSTSSFCFQSYFGRPFHGEGGSFFQRNVFHVGTNFVGKMYRGIILHGGLMIRSYRGERSFTKSIFQQSEHREFEKFSQPWWNIHLKIKPWPFYRITEGFILELNIVKRLCHDIWGTDILFIWGIDILFKN